LYWSHFIIYGKSDANRSAYLSSIVNTHSYQISHFFKLYSIFFGNVTNSTRFVGFINKLDDTVWEFSVFSKNRPNHKIFSIRGGALIINFSHKICFFIRAVWIVNLFWTKNYTWNAAIIWEVNELFVVYFSKLIKFLLRSLNLGFILLIWTFIFVTELYVISESMFIVFLFRKIIFWVFLFVLFIFLPLKLRISEHPVS